MRIIRVILIILTLLLALTATLAGIRLPGNFYAPPVEQLQGSTFKNFTIPGLVLGIIVVLLILRDLIWNVNKRKAMK